MALTVGGQAVEVNEEGEISSTTAAENLEANKTYKVGVRAYRTIEGGKYYSTEVESSGAIFATIYAVEFDALHE